MTSVTLKVHKIRTHLGHIKIMPIRYNLGNKQKTASEAVQVSKGWQDQIQLPVPQMKANRSKEPQPWRGVQWTFRAPRHVNQCQHSLRNLFLSQGLLLTSVISHKRLLQV